MREKEGERERERERERVCVCGVGLCGDCELAQFWNLDLQMTSSSKEKYLSLFWLP